MGFFLLMLKRAIKPRRIVEAEEISLFSIFTGSPPRETDRSGADLTRIFSSQLLFLSLDSFILFSGSRKSSSLCSPLIPDHKMPDLCIPAAPPIWIGTREISFPSTRKTAVQFSSQIPPGLLIVREISTGFPSISSSSETLISG